MLCFSNVGCRGQVSAWLRECPCHTVVVVWVILYNIIVEYVVIVEGLMDVGEDREKI